MQGEESAKNLSEWRVIVNVKSSGIAKKSEKINREDSRERREGRVRKAATKYGQSGVSLLHVISNGFSISQY